MLGAVVGVFHQIGQGLQRQPGRIGRGLESVPDVLQAVTGIVAEQGQFYRLCIIAAQVEGHACRDEGPVGQDGDYVLLSVAEVAAANHDPVAQGAVQGFAFRDVQGEPHGGRAVTRHRGHLTGRYGTCVLAPDEVLQGYGPAGGRVEQFQSGGHVHGFPGQVADAGRERDVVPLPQEAGNVGKYHQLFLGDDLPFGDHVPESLIVAEQAEFPGGERLGTGEADAQGTVFPGRKLRKPEGGFLQLGADLGGFLPGSRRSFRDRRRGWRHGHVHRGGVHFRFFYHGVVVLYRRHTPQPDGPRSHGFRFRRVALRCPGQFQYRQIGYRIRGPIDDDPVAASANGAKTAALGQTEPAVKQRVGREGPPLATVELVQARVVHRGQGGRRGGLPFGGTQLDRPALGLAGPKAVAEGGVGDLEFFVIPGQFEAPAFGEGAAETDEGDIEGQASPVGIGRGIRKDYAAGTRFPLRRRAPPALPAGEDQGQFHGGNQPVGKRLAHFHGVGHLVQLEQYARRQGIRGRVVHAEGGSCPGGTVGVGELDAVMTNGEIGREGEFILGRRQGQPPAVHLVSGGGPFGHLRHRGVRQLREVAGKDGRIDDRPVGHLPVPLQQGRIRFFHRNDAYGNRQCLIALTDPVQGKAVPAVHGLPAWGQHDGGPVAAQGYGGRRFVGFPRRIRYVGLDDQAEPAEVVAIRPLGGGERNDEAAVGIGGGRTAGQQLAAVTTGIAAPPAEVVAYLLQVHPVAHLPVGYGRPGIRERGTGKLDGGARGYGLRRFREGHLEAGPLIFFYPEGHPTVVGLQGKLPRQHPLRQFEAQAEATEGVAGNRPLIDLLVVGVP